MGWDVRDRTARAVATGRTLVYRVLDTVPPVRRTVDELLRVEVVDRTMVIAAQGLLALVPLVVVLAAFLPNDLTTLGLDRFESVTGIAAADTVPSLDSSEVRTQTGVVGLVLTLLSASSFARAVQRMYERVWALPHLGGLRGRRLCLGWLLGWLVALQGLSLVGWLADRAGAVALAPIWLAVRVLAATALWWWTLHVLLAGRVAWRALLLPGALTAAAVLAYSSGSTVVMPRYAAASAAQFGTLGLVLTVATWLVGLAGVLVVAAVVGRVLVEDQFTRRLVRRLVRRVRGPRSRAG